MKSLISTINRLRFNWRHRNNPIMLRSVAIHRTHPARGGTQ